MDATLKTEKILPLVKTSELQHVERSSIVAVLLFCIFQTNQIYIYIYLCVCACVDFLYLFILVLFIKTNPTF